LNQLSPVLVLRISSPADLRKHLNRHSKHLFCQVEGYPQSEACSLADSSSQRGSASGGGGFSSKKDRVRHEAKYRCGWVFSRMDSMTDEGCSLACITKAFRPAAVAAVAKGAPFSFDCSRCWNGVLGSGDVFGRWHFGSINIGWDVI
jgi:hypothetical protein